LRAQLALAMVHIDFPNTRALINHYKGNGRLILGNLESPLVKCSYSGGDRGVEPAGDERGDRRGENAGDETAERSRRGGRSSPEVDALSGDAVTDEAGGLDLPLKRDAYSLALPPPKADFGETAGSPMRGEPLTRLKADCDLRE
jgi:hypothetical protein